MTTFPTSAANCRHPPVRRAGLLALRTAAVPELRDIARGRDSLQCTFRYTGMTMEKQVLSKPMWKRLNFEYAPDASTSGKDVGIVVLDRIRPHATLRHLG